MLIAQITDTHVSTPGSRNDRDFHTGAYLERAVAHLNRLSPRPDVVLVTGDLVERGEVAEYRIARELLAGLAMPAYLIPGNHDDRANLPIAFDHHRYLPRDGGFVQYAVEDWPVRLLALDTLVPGEPGGRLCDERLGWLDARLSERPAAPTVVFMHHPPFVTGMAAMDAMGLDGAADLAAVIGRHRQVERVVAGHLHRPIVQRFAGTVASTAPATAHQLALDLGPEPRIAIVMEPAACALHQWLGDAGLVSHLSVIGDRYVPFTVFDGRDWVKDVALPAGFHPTPLP